MLAPPSTSPAVDPDRIVRHAASAHIHRKVLEVLDLLTADKYVEESKETLRDAIANRTGYWDLCCSLAAYADLHRPRSYLEIGVRRGRSACVVAAVHPDVDLYLFDMWAENYAGVPNPGPEFVQQELARVGHRGRAHFVSGRSQQTLPAFLASSPDPLMFELVTVDGDHRDTGALADLNQIAPRLARGGMLVFDDITHPQFPTLGNTWRTWVAGWPELEPRENTRDGTGTAIACRA